MPAVLLVFGITAGGTLLSLINWHLPIGLVALLASLVYLETGSTPRPSRH